MLKVTLQKLFADHFEVQKQRYKIHCHSLPVLSFSLSCLLGGSSVSQGVDWLMGVCPHLTLGARTGPAV